MPWQARTVASCSQRRRLFSPLRGCEAFFVRKSLDCFVWGLHLLATCVSRRVSTAPGYFRADTEGHVASLKAQFKLRVRSESIAGGSATNRDVAG